MVNVLCVTWLFLLRKKVNLIAFIKQHIDMTSLGHKDTDEDEFVKSELSKFIFEHTGLDALSSIDEIVLSYIIGVLESLGSANSPEDVFDVDEFAEMMTAYLPAFSNIYSSHIYAWMLNLADCLKEVSKNNEINKTKSLAESLLFKTHERQRSVSESSNSGVPVGNSRSRSRRKSYQSSNSYSSSQSEDDEKCIAVNGFEIELETLTEMFPHLHVIEVKQFLSMSNGDCEKAAQLILQKEESGQELNKHLTSKSTLKQCLSSSKEKIVEDKQLREQILKRYAFIDADDDVREHKPVAPKTEPKKLIRYRDNKIVSIKGERYSEIKGAEDAGDAK